MIRFSEVKLIFDILACQEVLTNWTKWVQPSMNRSRLLYFIIQIHTRAPSIHRHDSQVERRLLILYGKATNEKSHWVQSLKDNSTELKFTIGWVQVANPQSRILISEDEPKGLIPQINLSQPHSLTVMQSLQNIILQNHPNPHTYMTPIFWQPPIWIY